MRHSRRSARKLLLRGAGTRWGPMGCTGIVEAQAGRAPVAIQTAAVHRASRAQEAPDGFHGGCVRTERARVPADPGLDGIAAVGARKHIRTQASGIGWQHGRVAARAPHATGGHTSWQDPYASAAFGCHGMACDLHRHGGPCQTTNAQYLGRPCVANRTAHTRRNRGTSLQLNRYQHWGACRRGRRAARGDATGGPEGACSWNGFPPGLDKLSTRHETRAASCERRGGVNWGTAPLGTRRVVAKHCGVYNTVRVSRRGA